MCQEWAVSERPYHDYVLLNLRPGEAMGIVVEPIPGVGAQVSSQRRVEGGVVMGRVLWSSEKNSRNGAGSERLDDTGRHVS